MSARRLVYVGDGVLYVLPDPAQFDDDRIRVAVALRNQATLDGRCSACGASVRLPNRAQRRRHKGKVLGASMRHAAECPCADDRLRELLVATRETNG